MCMCLYMCTYVCVCVYVSVGACMCMNEQQRNRGKGESGRLVVPKTMTGPPSSGGGVCYHRPLWTHPLSSGDLAPTGDPPDPTRA